MRAALKPKEHYSADDFPVGRRVVCETPARRRNGCVGYALCEVLDVYPTRDRYHSDGLAIHGRVIATADKFLESMIGHIGRLHLEPRGRCYSGLRVTTIAPKSMFASAIVDRNPEGEKPLGFECEA